MKSKSKSIQIFRPGAHAPAITADQLKNTVDAYDVMKHEAPIVIGHPTDAGMAQGWIKSLDFNDETQSLEAVPQQVNANFAQSVDAGEYKKISASFYLPNSKSNSAPGTYYLRHVGFLGAQPPAVKGMRPPQFSETETEADYCTVEFSDSVRPYTIGTIGRLLRRLREMLIEKDGIKAADEAMSSWDIESIEEAGQATDTTAQINSNFSETTQSETTQGDPAMADDNDNAAARKKIDDDAAQLAADQAEFAEKVTLAAKKDAIDFAEDLVKAGKILPHQAGAIADLITAQDSEASVDFAETAEAESKPLATGDFLKKFLSELPAQVDFDEVR